MRTLPLRRAIACAMFTACALGAAELHAQTNDPDAELVGLWKAKQRFGADTRGPLLITRTAAGYSADMIGLTVPVVMKDGELLFELPNHDGAFRGRPQANGTIRGFWMTGPLGATGTATPVVLMQTVAGQWQGDVAPPDNVVSFYLLVTRRPDGTLAALLRNIERDYGALLGVRGLVRNGDQVSLIGRRGAQTRDTTIVTGGFDSVRQVLTLVFPARGGSFDFERETDELSPFYPRGRTPARYTYRVPPALADGWPVASVDDVGMERAAVERFVQHVIDMSMDSINAPQVHSLLIVRHGKLVLEEYFHGEHRDRPHNTRSASKSVSATIIGAAMQAGAPIRLFTPVYAVMNGGTLPDNLEPRKRAMTLEHLMTMSSGFFCDDNNDAAPGREDGMWEQTEVPDFYTFALALPMAMAPGEQAIYCSINPNLALGMVGRAAHENPMYLFDRLVARPLGIERYIWPLDRARNPYGGGGMGLRTRDFIKFGQLMLNRGTWQGTRILSEEFAARAATPLMKINQRGYGLLWWPEEKTYRDRVVQEFAALGAGGQIVMVFPEFDMVVATTGGSYSSRGWRFVGGELMSSFILPAIRVPD